MDASWPSYKICILYIYIFSSCKSINFEKYTTGKINWECFINNKESFQTTVNVLNYPKLKEKRLLVT